MQYSYEQYRQVAREHADEAIDRNTKDHNKKPTQDNFKKENGFY